MPPTLLKHAKSRVSRAGTDGAQRLLVLDEHSQSNARIVGGLLGEFLREAAVLIAVFPPLDKVLQQQPLTVRFVFFTMAIVSVLLGLGIVLEVKRQ